MTDPFDKAKAELRTLAAQHLEQFCTSTGMSPMQLLEIGGRLYCGPSKQFHEGAFVCSVGRRMYGPRKPT